MLTSMIILVVVTKLDGCVSQPVLYEYVMLC